MSVARNPMSSKPMSGVTVLDLTRLFPFAYGTQLLAHAGADVIKVEGPGGEYGRDTDEIFRATNRGKRSVTLDLRTPEGADALLRMIEHVDVLCESFRPGYLERLGLGPEKALERNSRLVYCSASGYGQTGPKAASPGHDLNYAAMAGLTTVDGGAPALATTAYVDLASGWAMATAVAMGVAQVARTGEGSYYDLGMADIALSLNVLGVAYSQPERTANTRTGPLVGYPWPHLLAGECPAYGIYESSDGRRIAVASVEPKFWRQFLAAIGAPELEGERFRVGREADYARGRIAEILATRPRDEWLEHFAAYDVCVSEVHSSSEALSDPHFHERGMIVRSHDEIVPASPLNRAPIDDALLVVAEPGEHTAAVLKEMGFSDEEICRVEAPDPS